MATENASKFVTYRDIAQALGITTMAVSKALRDSPDISDTTKTKVRQKADELGYIPNSLASNLRSIKTNVIAVVFNSFHNPYFPIACYKLFNDIKQTENYQSQLFFCNRYCLDVDDVRSLMRNKCCGVVSFVEPTKEAAEFFEKKGIPFMLIGIRSELANVDCVYTDDYAGGTLVGKRFLEGGYKKALYASDSLSETSSRRGSGFCDALNAAGIAADWLKFDPEIDPVVRTCERIERGDVDFVFCFSDFFAIQVLNALDDRGFGGNVVFYGYDNLHKYYSITRKIKSVDSDMDRIIKFACDKVIEKIEGKLPAHSKIESAFDVKLTD